MAGEALETFLFTSESVNEGHPDKLCDQVRMGGRGGVGRAVQWREGAHQAARQQRTCAPSLVAPPRLHARGAPAPSPLIDAVLRDNPEFHLQVGEVLFAHLKAQYENGNPAAMPWLSKRVLGKLRDGSSSGGDPTGALFTEAYWCNNYYVPHRRYQAKF